MRYYIDTCIWRDFYENRFFNKPIGDYAAKLFAMIIKRRYTIIYSEIIVRELLKRYTKEEIMTLFNLLLINKILIRVKIGKN